MNNEMNLLELMNRAKDKIIENHMDILLGEWSKVYNALNSNKFTIAVVGEFSRGKSTLINKLLCSDLLPVDNLPTTSMLTKVYYNEKNVLKYIHTDGTVEKLEYSENVWDNLILNLSGNSPKGIVEVGTPVDWLKEDEVKIIDTPGAGDLSDESAAIVNDALISCDGAIIAISATNPMSLTEKSFIEEHLIVKKMPHIIIVLTRLDQIPKEERSRIIEYVKDKLTLWNMNIPIFISHDADYLSLNDYTSMCGISNIKNEINKWVSDSGHYELKQSQICTQMLYLLNSIKQMLVKEKNLVGLSKIEKEEALKEDEIEKSKRSLIWEDYRLEMMQRSNKCANWVDLKIKENYKNLVEKLQHELISSNNPQYWWTNELPYLLKNSLGEIAKQMEDTLEEILCDDIIWLNNAMTKDFNVNISSQNTNVLINNNVETSEFNSKEKDMNKIRTFMRIGITPASIIGYVLFGPFGVLVSLGGAIIGENLIDKNIEKQKEILKSLLEHIIEDNFENISKECKNRIHEIYNRASIEITQEERTYMKAEKNELMNAKFNIEHYDDEINKKIESIDEIINDTNTYMGV